MEIKGVSVKSTVNFFKKYDKKAYESLLNSLPPEVKKVYSGNIKETEWYDLYEYVLLPTDLFIKEAKINNPEEFMFKLGEYSAQYALTGIYKVFFVISTTNYLMKRVPKIMSTYYKNAQARIIDNGKKWFKIEISNFPAMTNLLEKRILGWFYKALTLLRCKNITHIVEQSIAKGHQTTIIYFEWE